MSTEEKKGMSVIVPFLNEEDGIEEFCRVLDEYAGTMEFDIETVFVDDGSTDNTVEVIKGFAFKNIKIVKTIALSRNFGSHSAIRAGLTKASYDICTWLGSDLQEPLELIPLAYSTIREKGYDAVYVDKKTIKVSRMNRFFSRCYSEMMRKYAVKNYSSGGISTIVFNSKIKEYLNSNIENNSSIMLQIMNAGFNYLTISLDYKERFSGKSKWTVSKKIKLLIDSFVAFSYLPIRMVSIVGIVMFIISIVFGFYTCINKIFNPGVPVGYSTLVCVLLLGFGITNISLGVLAEYLWRTYDAARNRQAFIIDNIQIIKE